MTASVFCKLYVRYYSDSWETTVDRVYSDGFEKRLVLNTVDQLTSFLRLAFCTSVYIVLNGSADVGSIISATDDEDAPFSDVCTMLFDGLTAKKMLVGTLVIPQT